MMRRSGHGRQAQRPGEIGLIGWWDIAWRTFRGFNDDSLLMGARSIAFSVVMALFPSLAAFVSLYGIVADAGKARDHLSILAGARSLGAWGGFSTCFAPAPQGSAQRKPSPSHRPAHTSL